MDRYKKLISNSIIFMLGSFGSKLIGLLMLPLYTHYLTASEYGTVDIVNTTVNLLIPLFTLELGQAALRYAIETQDESIQNKIFSNISRHALFAMLLILSTIPIFYYFDFFINYALLFVILLILELINNLYSQYIRGIGLVKEFAINGIIMTLVAVLSNIVLLVYFNFKVEGYIVSLILATFVSNVYLFRVSKGVQRLKVSNPDGQLLKEMLHFSIPIIPTSAMWWMINSSTRYFILYFIGAAGNGIYAVASKIPAIISVVTSIFSQAWQLSSFEEFESEDKDDFYTKIFNIYWAFLFLTGSGLLIILKPFLFWSVSDTFYESWRLSPVLILAVIYQSFSTFLGTNYSASKKTKGAFTTSVYGGAISLLTSLLLIPPLGLMGAGLSSALSFFVMFLIRLIDTRKYVVINLDIPRFLSSNFIFLTQTFFLFLMDGSALIFVESIGFFLMIIINGKMLRKLIEVLFHRLWQ